jgi:hypothetical protein
MDFRENTILITVPDDHYFRFEECDAYEQVKGKGMKEMDVGWVDGDDLWVVELKDYGQHIPADLRKQLAKVRDNVPLKVQDTLAMLGAAWSKTAWGRDLLQDIRQTCATFPDTAVPIRTGVIINIENRSDIQLLQSIKDRIAADLKGELEIMGVESIVVLPVGSPRIQQDMGITVQESLP